MATRAPGGTGGGDPSDISKESKSPGPSKLGGKVKRREYRVGLKKRQYDNEMKTKIMQQIDQGARNVDICHMYNVPESTVCSMRKQNSEIKKNLALAKKYFSPSGVGNHSGGERSVKTVTDYNKVIIILEHYLLRWINRRNDEDASITGLQIQDHRYFMDRSRTNYYFFHKVNAPSFAVLTFAPIFWHQLGAKVEAVLYSAINNCHLTILLFTLEVVNSHTKGLWSVRTLIGYPKHKFLLIFSPYTIARASLSIVL